MFNDSWDETINRFSEGIEEIIKKFSLIQKPHSLLDVSCGIGTQAIGLARQGYSVTASDISQAQVDLA